LGKLGKEKHSSSLINLLIKFFERITLLLADQIAVETPAVINFLSLNKYRRKICINGAPFINHKLFKIEKDLESRETIVGYIGRLREEKGVIQFVKAIPLVLKEQNDIRFLIGGDGRLFSEIENLIESYKLQYKVKLTSWISHDEELPHYLNTLKLLVLPSYSEGLPGIVQEAMACGTPVLATPVGGIPDVIKAGETGFIMENNSPECIAKNVIRALEHPNLEEIVKNARKLIEDEYSYEVMVRKCKNSIDELMRRKQRT